MTDDWNAKVIAEFRSRGGEVEAFNGAPLLLLTTIGWKTGRRHTTPVMYLLDDERYVVFASKAGAPENPIWFLNLVANPIVGVEVGRESFEAEATVLKGEERAALYAEQVERRPQFGEFQAMTTREIPVIALERL